MHGLLTEFFDQSERVFIVINVLVPRQVWEDALVDHKGLKMKKKGYFVWKKVQFFRNNTQMIWSVLDGL
jgi:hypothetical protein